MTNRALFSSLTLAGSRGRSPVILLTIVLFISSLLYFALLAPERFGAYHDDGIYATTAKALATGQGYKIISLPSEPPQTKYPPFYPWLLSLIWRVYPSFPENVTPLTLLSAISTLAFMFMSYRYLTSRDYATRWQALFAVGLAALNWRTMILATSMYSEMLYAALSVAALELAERNGLSGSPRTGRLGIFHSSLRTDQVGARDVLTGTVIGLAFLTRSSGLTLLGAVALYYAMRRRWKRGFLVVCVASLFVLGWAAWCYATNPAADGVNASYHATYFRDISGMIKGLQAESNSSALQIILTILQQNFFSAIIVSIPTVCAGLSYAAPPGLGAIGGVISACAILLVLCLVIFGFVRQLKTGLRLLHIYIVLYLALHLPIPYISYDRYLIPLLPFLLLFVIIELDRAIGLAIKGLKARGQLSQNLGAGFILLVVGSTVCLAIYGYTSGIRQSFGSLSAVYARAADDRQCASWIRANTDPSAVVMSYRDPTFYLYTDRKAAPLTIVKSPTTGEPVPSLLFNPISKFGVKYLIVTSVDFDHDYATDSQQAALKTLLEQNPNTFVLVYQSADGLSRIYRVDAG